MRVSNGGVGVVEETKTKTKPQKKEIIPRGQATQNVCWSLLAGLATVTPAAGFIGPGGAVILGVVAGVVCRYFSLHVKVRRGASLTLA